jgi:hypothetical protein
MTQFARPPVTTEFVGKNDSPTFPWERWFQAIANFLSAPTIPAQTPASSSSVGVMGSIVFDANFIYVCYATNKWKRVALSAF